MSTSTPPADDANRVAARDTAARIDEQLQSLSRRGIDSTLATNPNGTLQVILIAGRDTVELLDSPAGVSQQLNAFSQGINLGREHRHPETNRRLLHELQDTIADLSATLNDRGIPIAILLDADYGLLPGDVSIDLRSAGEPPFTLCDSPGQISSFLDGFAAALEYTHLFPRR